MRGMKTGGHVSRDEQFDLDLLRGAVRYQGWVLDALGPIAGNVVEVGAGSGNFTRWIAQRADRVTAVEPEAHLADRLAAARLPGVEVVRSRVEALAEQEPTFDLAISINVLEHIEDDLGALRVMGRLVKPGGRVAILVPAHQALYGKLDGRYHHLRRYSKRLLAATMTDAGLQIEHVRYFNPVGAIGWLLFVRMLGRTRLSSSNVLLSERIAVPLGRVLDRIGFRPFGQSVLAVARRRG
jgi:SAM-dependent methyltransferase